MVDLEVGWIDCSTRFPGTMDIGWGGRTDRGDGQDQEPVVIIPLKDLTMLKGRAC